MIVCGCQDERGYVHVHLGIRHVVELNERRSDQHAGGEVGSVEAERNHRSERVPARDQGTIRDRRGDQVERARRVESFAGPAVELLAKVEPERSDTDVGQSAMKSVDHRIESISPVLRVWVTDHSGCYGIVGDREVATEVLWQSLIETEDGPHSHMRSPGMFAHEVRAPIYIMHAYQDQQTGPTGAWLWKQIGDEVPKQLVLTNGCKLLYSRYRKMACVKLAELMMGVMMMFMMAMMIMMMMMMIMTMTMMTMIEKETHGQKR